MEIKLFVKENPEIGAAMITAICGIISIFINVFINFLYRKKEYKDKHLIQNLEIMETFYFPFERLICCLLNTIERFDGCQHLLDIVNKSSDSKNDSNRVILKNIINEIDKHVVNQKHNYIGDYKLYLYQSNVLKIIELIKNYTSIDDDLLKKITVNSFDKEIKKLIDRIEERKLRLFSKNFLQYIYYKAQKRINYKKLNIHNKENNHGSCE